MAGHQQKLAEGSVPLISVKAGEDFLTKSLPAVLHGVINNCSMLGCLQPHRNSELCSK